MRALRIASPAQLPLFADDRRAEPAVIWQSLPEETRQSVLAGLARLIRAGSVETEEATG
ncbi:MAG: hypothetical protein ACRDSE_24155 [Pseudonocardiaceae bacterium]